MFKPDINVNYLQRRGGIPLKIYFIVAWEPIIGLGDFVCYMGWYSDDFVVAERGETPLEAFQKSISILSGGASAWESARRSDEELRRDHFGQDCL